ncbi:hypothetical protein [Paenibacillus xanthanilyticus]|uniref:Uncharacterized protein n=1 Tax=Paenibacillus xanthanilyticus TaxID=1783531 RepID=A0ABV8KC43_9BACL
MEKIVYCRFCNEEHPVSETRDSADSVVGLFCNRQKAMITAFTTYWNGEDILPAIERFADRTVDKVALTRIRRDKIDGLAKKISYQFRQSNYAEERKISYYFAQHHVLDVIRAMRERLAHTKAVI